ncbi:Nif-specific ferredoxin III [Bradyrhizobium sp. LM3.4]
MSFRTRDGRNWRPDYLVSIDPNKCIGCGRCYKICGREVMTLKGLSEGGEIIDLDEDDDELEKKVMVLKDVRRLHRLQRLRPGVPNKLSDPHTTWLIQLSPTRSRSELSDTSW